MSEKNWKYFRLFYTAFLVIAFLTFVVPLFLQIFTGKSGGPGGPRNNYAPSPINPVEVGANLTDAIEYSLDASDKMNFVYFDFSRSGVVEIEDPGSLEWDLAFRRAKILTNGGATNPKGAAAAALMGNGPFEEYASVTENLKFEKDTIPPKKALAENKTLSHWYDYSFLGHELTASPAVYAIRTADGKYAKLRIMSYYCGDAPACYTLRYVYQGNGGKEF